MDKLKKEERTRLMASIGREATAPETSVRRAARALGYSFQANVRRLPGTPDIVFPRLRVALFVHGCFWHKHNCRKGRSLPVSNRQFWRNKLVANLARDRRAARLLRQGGWHVYVVWECQTRAANLGRLKRRLSGLLARAARRAGQLEGC